MAYMTRDEMVAVLRRNETVLHKGRLLATEADLPTEAELASSSGDPAKVEAAREALDAQIKALQDAKASLQEPKAAVPTVHTDPPTPAKSDVPPKAPKVEAK